MKDIVVTLTSEEQLRIAKALMESAKDGDVMQMMIQEDGLKAKHNYGIWSPPIGTPE